MNELEFTYLFESAIKRKGFRTKVPGLMAELHGFPAPFSVNDISAGGLCIKDPDGLVAIDGVVTLDLALMEKHLLSDVRAKVSRHQEGLAGLFFEDLTRRQEERLDKLVLEVQKRAISKSKTNGLSLDGKEKT